MMNIEKQFVGPPGNGNGGYVCGRLASHIDGPAEVTLRAPCPLETDLDVQHQGQDAHLVHGDEVIAVAKPTELTLTPPEAISFDQAVAASRHYTGFHDHPFPGCFVCGPNCAEGAGLRLFAGAIESGEDRVATPWIPHANHADAEGHVPPEIVWAALDCPGAFSVDVGPDNRMLLGRLTAEIFHTPMAGDPCIVQGWKIGQDGRKSFTGTALYGVDGQVLGLGSAVWIAI